jgi:hypothetical protein
MRKMMQIAQLFPGSLKGAAVPHLRTFPVIFALMSLLDGAFAAEKPFFPTNKRNESSRKGWYSKHLKAMGEPSLYMQSSQPGLEFRFLHLPTFHKPSAIRITATSTGAELHIVRLTGAGGYDPGRIESERTRKLDESQWRQFLTLLEKASFWQLPEEEDYQSGNDGSRWILDGRSNGRYRVVDRWSPKGETSERKLEAFVACCEYLWGLAEFSKKQSDGYY